ncbi:MAG: hypothetical protein ABJA98_07225 [Acidobacteriota bacterium]
MLSRFIRHLVVDREGALAHRLARLEASNRCLQIALDGMLVSPKFVPSEEVGFNGQACRKRIFQDILAVAPVEAIVETGTCLGDTTGYMALTSQLPVHTCDLNPRFHALAKTRLSEIDSVHLNLLDSRSFLRERARGPMADRLLLFYLDAHWYDDLPLSQELDIIASEWTQFIVMVDDFQVPDDPGYGYDNYGVDKALTLDLLRPSIAQHDLAVFFPTYAAVQETGARRGCVILTKHGEHAERLESVASLRRWAV